MKTKSSKHIVHIRQDNPLTYTGKGSKIVHKFVHKKETKRMEYHHSLCCAHLSMEGGMAWINEKNTTTFVTFGDFLRHKGRELLLYKQ